MSVARGVLLLRATRIASIHREISDDSFSIPICSRTYHLRLGPCRFLRRCGHPREERGGTHEVTTGLVAPHSERLERPRVIRWRRKTIHHVGIGEGHKWSACCSAGEWGGKTSRWRWSGTYKRCVLCQPVRSSTSTICLERIVPTAVAKAARCQRGLSAEGM